MRFHASAVVAALPLLARAQENPFGPYKAQLQQVLGKMCSYLPNPGRHDQVAALEAKFGPMHLSTLTLENWKETLYEQDLGPGARSVDEWWVLISGRNKTCFGHCGQVEKAFNETAAKFATTPGAPHMALLNCDDQPILCNSWAAGTGHIWSFGMVPDPDKVEIYKKRLNLTSTTSDDLVALHEAETKEGWVALESWFHPFTGQATELGLAVPWGYIIWAFNLVPNWLFMIIVSFASRSMMGNRMGNMANDRRPGAPGSAGAAGRAQRPS
ncbi:hypothetical protein DCS_07271 [Drechmeria coniospora]|uniref:Peptidyl-tRNA hydrolase n=1 Tax=Drechmeria coniospora TaxID=98403 RepID=A0A151GDZ2_DRECN|nr:hypothetical protein DCS_07271 [Drechmeria coniospora]KYK55308.1 hypothetical protein DCS_07271 [Drechmeria coniospora]ODA82077.1 hypothetical protein RJ55_00582 [Drechmeria coniospora]